MSSRNPGFVDLLDADGEMVIISVGKGEDQKRYRVHKKVLCSRSKYFEKMFTSGIRKTTKSTVSLPDDDPDIFAIFLEYVYSQKLQYFYTYDKADPDFPEGLRLGICLYAFAEKICDFKLCDYALVNILWCYGDAAKTKISEEPVRLIPAYSLTAAGSPLRRVFLQYALFFMRVLGEDELKDYMAEVIENCPDLALDIILELQATQRQITPNPLPDFNDCCHFHHHAFTVMCPVSNEFVEFKQDEDESLYP